MSEAGASRLHAVRAACLRAAQAAYEDALQRGLCQEGAIEAAFGAIETLDVEKITAREENREDR